MLKYVLLSILVHLCMYTNVKINLYFIYFKIFFNFEKYTSMGRF